MNYGMFLLGTSLVIVHFLRLLCSVHANYLHDRRARLPAVYDGYPFDPDTLEDDLVRGWMTDDPHLRIRNLIKSLWPGSNDAALNAFFELSPGNARADLAYEEVSLSGEDSSIEECEFSQFSESPLISSTLPDDGGSPEPPMEVIGSSTTPENEVERPGANLTSTELFSSMAANAPVDLNATLVKYNCKYFKPTDVITVICDDPKMTSPVVLPESVEIELLIVNFTQVQTLGPQAFGFGEVKSLKLHYNVIKCIHPQAFDGLRGVKLLSLAQNHLEYIRFSDFDNLPNLTTLSFEYNKIDLANGPIWFNPSSPYEEEEEGEQSGEADQAVSYDQPNAVLPSLHILSLVGNPLKQIPRTFFYPLRDSPIELLSLMNSQLKFIESHAFAWLRHMKTLDLSENPALMENLEIAFEGIVSPLRSLTLRNNNLAKIPTKELELVQRNLTTLDLSGNLFDTISKDCMPKGLIYLAHLNLENCRIRTMSIKAFDHLVNLETLILTNNRLSQVPSTVNHLRRLQTLDLSGNNPALSSTVSLAGQSQSSFRIPSQIFKNCSSLQNLNLDFLPLRYIQKDALAGLGELKILQLSYASIEVIEDFAFADLKSLQRLDLSYNKLAKVGGNTFFGLESLQRLLLNDNGIVIDTGDESVPSPINETKEVFQLTATTEGDMYDDESLPSEPMPMPPIVVNSSVPIFKYLSNLQELNMENNKVRCMQVAHFEYLKSLQKLHLTGNIITSWRVPILGNMTSLSHLYLAKNTIGPITEAMLQDFKEFTVITRPKTLDLTDNPFVCDENVCAFIQLMRSVPSLFTTDKSLHFCLEIDTNKYRRMFTDTADLCTKGPSITEIPGGATTTAHPGFIGNGPVQTIVKSASASTLAIIAMSMVFVLSVGTVGYKKRFHLKYFWFVVRFNVVNLPNLNISGKKRQSIHSYEFDVFLSYNHTDRKFVEDELVPNMEGELESYHKASDHEPSKIIVGDNYRPLNPEHINAFNSGVKGRKLKVCIHERDFTAGVPITENIVDFVDRSRKVVVVVSKNYLESQWCLYEMNLAYHRLIESKRKSFLVILLEDIPPTLRTKSLNYLLLSRTYLEWPGALASESEKVNFWKRLKQSLEAM